MNNFKAARWVQLITPFLSGVTVVPVTINPEKITNYPYYTGEQFPFVCDPEVVTLVNLEHDENGEFYISLRTSSHVDRAYRISVDAKSKSFIVDTGAEYVIYKTINSRFKQEEWNQLIKDVESISTYRDIAPSKEHINYLVRSTGAPDYDF